MSSGVGLLCLQIIRADIDLCHKDENDAMEWHELLKETCLLIRGLSIHDDMRREMSCAFDNGRFFMSSDAMPALMRLAFDFERYPSTAAAAISAVRQLITSEEAVQTAASCGATELPLAILSSASPPLDIVRSVTGLLRNLCADDNRKSRLVTDGTLSRLITLLTTPQYSTDYKLVEHGLACLAAMSLRSVPNSRRIVEVGALDPLIKGMRSHYSPTGAALQRQGCLAIRNIAARAPSAIHQC